jgi:hypothetical protein
MIHELLSIGFHLASLEKLHAREPVRHMETR